jgi:glycosyltransferase involved in cell wall biosynthesis
MNDTEKQATAKRPNHIQELNRTLESYQRLVAEHQHQVRELMKEKETSPGELAKLQKTLEEQTIRLQLARAEIDRLCARQKTLRELYLSSQEQLMHRDQALITQLTQMQQSAGPVIVGAVSLNHLATSPTDSSHDLEGRYQMMVNQEDTGKILALKGASQPSQPVIGESAGGLLETVAHAIPANATVLVLSEGDETLLQLGERIGWHFPRTEGGGYSGPPSSGSAAVVHLENLRARGASYLVVPSRSFSWLDRYAGFWLHVGRYCKGIAWQDDACVIFDLHEKPADERGVTNPDLVHEVQQAVANAIPPEAIVVIISGGEEAYLEREGKTPWHFPAAGDGSYLGRDPSSGEEVITHLKALREEGAEYLVVPAVAWWWFHRFPELRPFLDNHCGGVIWEDDTCLIFDLHEKAADEPHPSDDDLVARVREAVDQVVPPDAALAIATGGNEEFLEQNGRTSWHLPEAAPGRFLGHDPVDGADAIAHVESLRSRRAGFLVLPRPALGWLDRYAELWQHLENRCLGVAWHDDTCLIYDLHDKAQANQRSAEGDVTQRFLELKSDHLPGPMRIWLKQLLRESRQFLQGQLGGGGLVLKQPAARQVSQPNPELVIQLSDILQRNLPDTVRWLLRHFLRELKHYLKTRPDGVLHKEDLAFLLKLTSAPKEKPESQPEEASPLQAAVDQVVPPTEGVIVVSDDDAGLLQLGERKTWHFSQTDSGGFAGLPATSVEAIGQVEAMRAQGGAYLVFPGATRSLLEHYAALQHHLERHCRGVLWDDDVCLILNLHDKPSEEQQPLDPDLVIQIQDLVNETVPAGAGLAVVSEGEEALLVMGDRQTWHLLHDEAGGYADRNPENSAEAIAQLNELRAQGASFLLIPATTFWWLSSYPEFRDHVNRQCRAMAWEDDTCLIYELVDLPSEPEHAATAGVELARQEGANAPGETEEAADRPVSREIGEAGCAADEDTVQQIRDLVNKAMSLGAGVILLGEGNAELMELEGRRVWRLPQSTSHGKGGYPADSNAIIDELEELRALGGDFLLIPPSAQDWLKRYPGLRRYLEKHYRGLRHPIQAAHDVCSIFALTKVIQDDLSKKPFGVNIAGHIASEKGCGEATRATVRSLTAVDMPYVLYHHADVDSVNPDTAFQDFTKENPYGINLIQLNADSAPEFLGLVGKAYLKNRYNIGYWFWELSEFPKEWQSSFFGFDEIWVGSNFVLDAISRAAPIPVVRIPVSLPEKLELGGHDRSYFGIPDDRFVFLFIFDFMSIVDRKNPLGLIKAFKQAFSERDDAWLVLKCAHSEWAPEGYREFVEAATGTNIQILEGILSREEINSLLNVADCYVSLHRSEGFGLTMAEAMSLEKPVIATSYSGNMDFMMAANSFLVSYRLVELQRDYPPYKKGCVWAEPDLDHAVQLMRTVYENPKHGQAVGRTARRDILRFLHPKTVGNMIKERFLKISAFAPIAPPGVPSNGLVAGPLREGTAAPTGSRGGVGRPTP